MSVCIKGVQRRFYELNFKVIVFRDRNFTDHQEWLIAVLDNRFFDQQSRSMNIISHNVLTNEDVEKILHSEFWNRANTEGLRNRLIFAVGICVGVRTGKITMLETNRFTFENMHGRRAMIFSRKAGSS